MLLGKWRTQKWSELFVVLVANAEHSTTGRGGGNPLTLYKGICDKTITSQFDVGMSMFHRRLQLYLPDPNHLIPNPVRTVLHRNYTGNEWAHI